MPFKSELGVKIEFLGDSGPFSKLGQSICYKISYENSSYLIDCGAAVFSELTGDTINQLDGIIATHSHEDHRRWFVDLALFRFYVSKPQRHLRLIACETVLEEFVKTSRAALERTLSMDSKKVVEVPFTTFVEPVIFGPTAKYRIVKTRLAGEEGTVWRVIDERGKVVSAKRAKIVVHPEANRPRMIFRHFETNRWVEPESYYPFNHERFYTPDHNPYCDPNPGITFEAMKSTAWHGPMTTSVRITTNDENIYFSSDTVYDPALWKELATEVRPQNLDRSKKEFDSAHILYGDINDFIEQTWSMERYDRGMSLYKDHVLVHDAAGKNSIVHTDYEIIANSGHEKLLLTHSPDHFVSQFPLTLSGKIIRVIGGEYFEEVNGELWPFDADIYFKEFSHSFVGYKKRNGPYKVFVKNGLLDIVPSDEEFEGEELFRVALYADINGVYLPRIEDPKESYIRRRGKIFHVRYTKNGGKLKAMENIRGQVCKKQRNRL